MRRRAEFRPFSWLHDLWKRGQLDLDPPYQRRSVWPDRYKSDFVTTAMLGYPCPAIFLFEEIRPDGSFLYKVVDGKQRLTTLFSFVSNNIAIDEAFPNQGFRGRYFADLPDDTRVDIWRYLFAIEFIEQENETLINEIFNRINKNVSKLTPQELRHARFSGVFISTADKLADSMDKQLGSDFPRIAAQSKRQMKDVENVANLLLFIETGERSYSQLELDEAFSQRDEDWLLEAEVSAMFNQVIHVLREIVGQADGAIIVNSRLRNQADFYSLFAAISELEREGFQTDIEAFRARLLSWIADLKTAEQRQTGNQADLDYLAAARSASNDAGPRRVRINRVKDILRGI
jgi:hypothetical protein